MARKKKKLTPEDKFRDRLQGKPGTCGRCGSTDLDVPEKMACNVQVFAAVSCNTCLATWTLHYELKGVHAMNLVPLYCAEHPPETWKAEVADGTTRLGYEDWVLSLWNAGREVPL